MAEAPKKLKRLPDQGQIAGVCAGLADYFELDVTLVRVIFVVLAIITGGGFVLAYIVLALLMPSQKDIVKSKDGEAKLSHNAEVLAAEMRTSGRGEKLRNYLGFGLIALGVWFLLGELFPGWFSLRWEYVWPLVLIVLGLYIATRRK